MFSLIGSEVALVFAAVLVGLCSHGGMVIATLPQTLVGLKNARVVSTAPVWAFAGLTGSMLHPTAQCGISRIDMRAR